MFKAWTNRQPTLWRFGVQPVHVKGIADGNVIATNIFDLEMANADFDGDTEAVYTMFSEQAQAEIDSKRYDVLYDHNDRFLHTLRHEALLGAYLLTSTQTSEKHEVIDIETVDITPELLQKYDKYDCYVGDERLPFGLVLFNIWAGFNYVAIRDVITKRNVDLVNKMILFDIAGIDPDKLMLRSERQKLTPEVVKEYQRRLAHLARNLLFFVTIVGISVDTNALTLKLELPGTAYLLQHLPKDPVVGCHVHAGLARRFITLILTDPKFERLRKLLLSGSRFSETQLIRGLISIGYIANERNLILTEPIPYAQIEGLDEDELFRSSYGTRKGLTDKALATPQSGYLERTEVLNLSPIELVEGDCGTKLGINIRVSAEYAKMLVGKYYKTSLTDPEWRLFTSYKDVEPFIGKSIYLRSAILCKQPDLKVCRRCFGEIATPSPFVGVIAGQVLSERFTQLIMRVFHTSGSAQLDLDKQLVELCEDALCDIEETDTDVILTFTADAVENPRQLLNSLAHLGLYEIEPDTESQVPVYKFKFRKQGIVANTDTIAALNAYKKLLVAANNMTLRDIQNVYTVLMLIVNDIGSVHSAYVETLLCNMYVYDNKPLRYVINESNYAAFLDGSKVLKRLSIRMLCQLASPLLSLLYQPNKNTIKEFGLRKTSSLSSIYERIWFGKIL